LPFEQTRTRLPLSLLLAGLHRCQDFAQAILGDNADPGRLRGSAATAGAVAGLTGGPSRRQKRATASGERIGWAAGAGAPWVKRLAHVVRLQGAHEDRVAIDESIADEHPGSS